ncbi:Imm30 family immunity protein [Tumebacillus sp. BK434]|uniref:Imm30 family immunity protein n=1 Tax=Tumebacillus sp. BK434 TaxID=2512169 RepID=UPI001FB3AC1F|nr:Imm30 family immunity protein [Tumebacillus sp. BK434]
MQKNLVEQLMNNRLLRTKEEIGLFESSIESLMDLGEESLISDLCSGFDDSTEHNEAMFGLVHAIESLDIVYGQENALRKLAGSLPALFPHAKGWAVILNKRILNHDPSLIKYAEVVKDLDPDKKELITSLVREIKEEPSRKFETAGATFLTQM